MTEPGDGTGEAVRGPIDASRIPRYAGPPTFALLPWRGEVSRCDVVVAGVPFDSGTSYRPGARFGPSAVRQGSRLLRPWHPALEVSPLAGQQVADAGDIACNPFRIEEAIAQIEHDVDGLLRTCEHVIQHPPLGILRREDFGGERHAARFLRRCRGRAHGESGETCEKGEAGHG